MKMMMFMGYWHVILTILFGGGGGGKPEFENVISRIRSILRVGKESNKAFKYCGIDLDYGEDGVIYLDQIDYTDLIKPVEITASRALEKDSDLTECEKHSVRSKVGQLLWLAHQSRPDLLFDVTSVANNINKGTVQHVLEIRSQNPFSNFKIWAVKRS
jgi:hypothetical protein